MSLEVRHLGLCAYQDIWDRMRAYTESRTGDSPDQLWLVQHPPVFTQGQAGKPEHLLAPSPIPVIQTDRGGQVTYHGPGQLVAYPLLDIRRKGLGVRELVSALENTLIATLADYALASAADPAAPGVYIEGRKIGSLGLRIRRGCSYHGLALNVDMDLSPFHAINPCGYAGLRMTQLIDEIGVSAFDPEQWKHLQERLIGHFEVLLGYT